MPMVKFEPTDEQREGVAHLASAGVLTLEEIAKQVVNPRTGRSISVKTLNRIFKQELAENTQLKKRVLEQYRAAVDRGESWAVKFGMEHLVGVSGKDKDKDGAAKPSRVENINVLFRGASPGRGTRADNRAPACRNTAKAPAVMGGAIVQIDFDP